MKRPEQQGWYWARWGGGPWAACHTAESDLHDEEDPNFEWGVRILEPGEGPDVARALELLRELKWDSRLYEYQRAVKESIAALERACDVCGIALDPAHTTPGRALCYRHRDAASAPEEDADETGEALGFDPNEVGPAPDRHMNSNAGGGEQTNTRPSELGTPELGDSKVTSDSATGSTAPAPAAEAPDLPDGWEHHHPLEGHEYADAEGFVRVWVSNDGTRVRVTNGRPPTVADVHAVLAYHRSLLGGTRTPGSAVDESLEIEIPDPVLDEATVERVAAAIREWLPSSDATDVRAVCAGTEETWWTGFGIAARSPEILAAILRVAAERGPRAR